MTTLVVYLFVMIMVDEDIEALYNVARFKPAVQCNDLGEYYAYLGVDGNYDPNAFNNHCQHTHEFYNPWWMVDLCGQFVIEKIQLTNRQDVYLGKQMAYHLRNFFIEIFPKDPRQYANFPNVYGQVCYQQVEPLGPATFNFTCPSPIVGRYVRIIMRNNVSEVLHTCEMEVLVSSASQEEIYFKKQKNTKLLDTPFTTLTNSDYFRCLQKCLQRKYTDYCTAFNWVTSTRSCQLFSINPVLALNLTSAVGTHFYIQSQK
ncbi:fucolectin [Biomphalaria glabrata]|nr:fucolectin [Biomphalaria glabrata]